jgi:hypothetical protein
MSARERRVVTVLGTVGMGKSALAKKLVANYQDAHGPDSVRVLDPSYSFGDLGEWPGRRGVDEWINEVTGDGEGPRNGGWSGLLVLDDADRYLFAHSYDSFRDVWLANRHLGLDVIVTAHRPQGVPKELLSSSSELWLFAQEEANALDYLARLPSVGARFKELGPDALPTEKGLALRVVPRARSADLVRVFD